MDAAQERTVFTIGHSNHTPDAFLTLLKRHRIDLVVDVRSRPYSRFAPHFHIKRIQRALRGADVEYLFLGKELGGMPEEDEFYDKAGFVLYHSVARSERFQLGIARLEETVPNHRGAIMCGEENPMECHRRLLIGKILTDRGIHLKHIRGDGRLQTEQELEQKDPHQMARSQRTLFQDSEGALWRSARPVRQ